jgi:hypothetical protein
MLALWLAARQHTAPRALNELEHMYVLVVQRARCTGVGTHPGMRCACRCVLAVARERHNAMDRPLIVIVPANQCVLEVLCQVLRDAGYDTLILDSTALDQHVGVDGQLTRPDAAAPAQESALSPESAPLHLPLQASNPQAAALEVLREICESLSDLPFGWQVAIIKALLAHACTVARRRGPPPQHTTPSV